jgi:uncharacterized protein with von Willebrand factor type A (vWA) domain
LLGLAALDAADAPGTGRNVTHSMMSSADAGSAKACRARRHDIDRSRKLRLSPRAAGRRLELRSKMRSN